MTIGLLAIGAALQKHAVYEEGEFAAYKQHLNAQTEETPAHLRRKYEDHAEGMARIDHIRMMLGLAPDGIETELP
ncbi:MAG: hypothetical protein HS103_17445 [Anaerolineales bacterium]|nr:hypothetical protein [Anaerolineales bacterium]